MNRVAARGLHATAQRVLQYSGSVNLGDVISTNADGAEWSDSVDSGCNMIEKADPRIKQAHIQGARAHRSSKDRNDSKDVITVALLTATGTRVGSAHFHLDGSFKFFPSRAGKLGGFADNLQKAGLVVEEGGPERNTGGAGDENNPAQQSSSK
ncbi:hypothetical protein BDBG_03990 [Blastomyces gilchristii SLH14081]|uniref:Uncharacterized protein n=1 Tax=Blastomyces gilchristii (strain SLH14081) TaxID=559298 RepID=A0A179ULV3_BLAGS|nr:uncharacterized protein BDBG_03990 [Blastomyces gilchristii SLH14081]EQL29134.1 hypothetical protein BDFG_08200 [Blastomyces dermatitidis ATCC 26199]OAT07991.1 hypothetical protein BDBG_03990 [Blastomyces gilchristii SLH14081]